MDIRNCIAELLSLHDCVIIPGFGGFIGNYSPARIDPVHHAFQPPAKKLLFNVNLKQNDGLLANAVAATFGTSYADACKLIDEFSEDCRFVLKAGKSFVLPEVGQLYPGNEGIIYFEQDQTANLLPDAFGLAPFISPPVIRHSSILTNNWNLASQGARQPGKRFVLPRALKWAAVIVLPIGVAAVIGVTQYDKITANFANNAGLLTSVFTRFSAASLVEKKEAPAIHHTKVVKAIPAAKTMSPPVETRTAIRYDDRYAVIVGAFRMKENAEKLVAELQEQGIEASIFDQSKTGLFRVTIGTCSVQSDAKQLLASAKTTDFSGAWILEK
ncbi:MAG: SPOR domain-containing protein [Bacteroidetes bacterium]|nr:SPOR domain-containing protein [Bacteroidota bacterium]